MVLSALETDPLTGLVSPSLMGSSGVIPLSYVQCIYRVSFFTQELNTFPFSIPGIIHHTSEVIIHAEKEIFLATSK